MQTGFSNRHFNHILVTTEFTVTIELNRRKLRLLIVKSITSIKNVLFLILHGLIHLYECDFRPLLCVRDD